jgi:hypothetical protein
MCCHGVYRCQGCSSRRSVCPCTNHRCCCTCDPTCRLCCCRRRRFRCRCCRGCCLCHCCFLACCRSCSCRPSIHFDRFHYLCCPSNPSCRLCCLGCCSCCSCLACCLLCQYRSAMRFDLSRCPRYCGLRSNVFPCHQHPLRHPSSQGPSGSSWARHTSHRQLLADTPALLHPPKPYPLTDFSSPLRTVAGATPAARGKPETSETDQASASTSRPPATVSAGLPRRSA